MPYHNLHSQKCLVQPPAGPSVHDRLCMLHMQAGLQDGMVTWPNMLTDGSHCQRYPRSAQECTIRLAPQGCNASACSWHLLGTDSAAKQRTSSALARVMATLKRLGFRQKPR